MRLSYMYSLVEINSVDIALPNEKSTGKTQNTIKILIVFTPQGDVVGLLMHFIY